MLRKTLIALTTVAALGVGSTAMAAMHGSWGGQRMTALHGSWGGQRMTTMQGSWGGRVGTFSGRPFTRSAFFHNRFHRFHHRHIFLFGAGFANNCWIWTRWGWQYVCGYPY